MKQLLDFYTSIDLLVVKIVISYELRAKTIYWYLARLYRYSARFILLRAFT